MEIQGPGGISGPNRIDPQNLPADATDRPGEASSGADRVEISRHAELLEKLSEVPAVRTEKIEELRKEIEAGRFETSERLRGAVEKLLEEL